MADSEDVQPRAKRQKKDKFGRLAAFDRLKSLKGTKNKCDIADIDNVYETVDEREYSKSASSKYEDWIVDDDGSGYVEDGRDIFDDDLDEESIAKAARNSEPKKKKKKAVSDNAGKGKLQFMLSNMPSKKKEEVNLENDDILSELISEIDDSTKSPSLKPKPVSKFAEMKAARDYMNNFSMPKTRVKYPLNEIEISDPIHSSACNEITEVPEIKINENENIEEDVETPFIKDTSKKLLFKIEKPIPIEKKSTINTDESALIDAELCLDDFNDGFDDSQLGELDAENLLKNWNKMHRVKSAEFEFEDEIDFDDVVIDEKHNKFRFFWWDAYEDAQVQPGVVFLFGRTFEKDTKKYISCCVVVRNIQRKIFLLPRTNRLSNDEPVSILDVYQEFKDKVATEYKIDEFKSKKVEKKYAFDPEVSIESEYLEIRYSPKISRLPSDLAGDTYSRIFGTESSYLELVLLDARIRGPCWLDVSSFTVVTNPISYCVREVNCDRGIASLAVAEAAGRGSLQPPPPLVVAAVNIQPVTDAKGQNEIALVSVLVQTRYHVERKAPLAMFDEHFCVMTIPTSTISPPDLFTKLQSFKSTRVQKMNTEKALLNYFISQIARIDPDLIVGHDLQGYQFNILADRIRSLDAANYSRLSRVRRANLSKSKDNKLERILTTGRLICDIKISAKELIKSRSYDLDSLCQNVLKIPEGERIEIDATDVRKMYLNTTDLLQMISLQMQDTAYILKMMYELNVIPLALQITNIAGNVMSRTLLGGRSERNEFLLLHAFTEKNYIVPDKKYKRAQAKVDAGQPSRKKPTYLGGLVLEPKVGFYNDLVLLMDFNSLYPSIIQEFNICFTTIGAKEGAELHLPDSSAPVGILPTEIRKLVESRKHVKKLMKKPEITRDLAVQYHIRQTALKLTANSMYGCLGFANSRFYAKNLAELITLKGREILVRTKELAEKIGYDVIYGDTDSIMINTHVTDYDQVMKIGYKIKTEVNRLYKQVELDIDGVFKFLLLLKKKKYAALVLSKDKNGAICSNQEHKGLDIVRRDCAQIAVEAGKFVLNHILSENTQTTEELTENIHNHLRQLADDLRADKVPLSLLVITKQLTKNPSLYTNSTALPHVTVAKRYNTKNGRKFNAGDTISYLICADGSDLPATQRAYHIDEYKRSCAAAPSTNPPSTSDTPPQLRIDTRYYLAQQVHPVVSRLCDPIDGTSAEQLADCLGLDQAAFKRSGTRTAKEGLERVGVNLKDPAVKYRGAKPFEFKCPTCRHPNTVAAPLVGGTPALDRCSNADCTARPLLDEHDSRTHHLRNQLQLAIGAHTRRYYRHELQCEDPLCTQTTSTLPTAHYRRLPVCVFCGEGVMMPVYSARDLHTQLLFFEYLMDVNQWSTKPIIEKQLENNYDNLRRTVTEVLDKSAYSVISLAYIARIVRKPESLPTMQVEIDKEDIIEINEDDDYYFENSDTEDN